jgi:hypothetical protein
MNKQTFALQILAGRRAYQHIQQHGLQADDIGAVMGASGAAKWLAIVGLDQAVFEHFLPQASRPMLLYVTSVGAYKLAAAAQQNPRAALDRLADAYINSETPTDLSAQGFADFNAKIVETVLGERGADEILRNQQLLFSCGAVACSGPLAAASRKTQSAALLWSFLESLGKSKQPRFYRRQIFAHPAAVDYFQAGAAVSALSSNAQHFHQSLQASGSLPVYMQAVQGLAEHHEGVFRDGGLLDYHPVPSSLPLAVDGLVLYPHFYPHLVERWMYKFQPWRKVAAKQLDNVVLICPSAEFVASLPYGRIPSRADIQRFKGRDAERQQYWRTVRQRSDELGDAFLEWLAGNQAARQLVLLN